MKHKTRLKCGILLFFILINSSPAQNYFPVNSGNKFLFHQYYVYETPAPQFSYHWKKMLMTEGVMYQGKKFIKIHGPSKLIENGFYYFDDSEQILYKLQTVPVVAVNFNVAAGDSFISYITGNHPIYMKSHGIENVNTFFGTKQGYKISNHRVYGTTEYFNSYIFVDSLGLVESYNYVTDWAYPPFFRKWTYRFRLRSAIIDTSIYGPITLNITSLSPSGNLTEDQFPVTFHCNYTTNLNFGNWAADTLINSFYLNVIHIRDTDTLQTVIINFDRFGKAPLNILPEAGDNLFIKAFISDSTIFNNYDTFPDSGYAEILVLPSTTDVNEEIVSFSFQLNQNYPNPFNPSTIIKYSVASASFVTIKVYDVLGNEIATLVDEYRNAGSYEVVFNVAQFSRAELSSGVYYYQLKAGDFIETKKMILLR